ncbi:MAG: hypothetical protein ACYC5S_04740 [Thiobacillus sp.]
MKALAAAMLAASLAACASRGGEAAASRPAAAKPLPYAPPPPSLPEADRMCTQDARQCPDGSYVGRNAARGCAFNPCPGDTPQ